MKISVTRALSELNLLDARISRAIAEGQYVAIQIGEKLISGHIKPEDFKKDADAKLQQIKALIARRNEIKSKIIASNAVTEVTFPSGKVMTVAEVIERKGNSKRKSDQKSGIDYDKMFLHSMRVQYANVITSLQKEQQKSKDALEARISANLGKDAEARKGKESFIEEITKSFNAENEPKLIDPVSLKKQIDDLTSEIEEFETECDFLLTESNTRTDIEVSE